MDAEAQVVAALEDDQKVRQAKSMPTSSSSTQPARVLLSYARRRSGRSAWRGCCPTLPPFVGAAVMTPSLDDPDVGIALGVRANLSDTGRRAVDELVGRLGLTGL